MSDEFERAIERVMADRSPLEEIEHLDTEERSMLRVAQMLRGSAGSAVRPEFVDDLHDRLFPPPVRISRRTAFLGGLGTLAAGLIAGLGLDRLTARSTRAPTADATAVPGLNNQLVGINGRWAAVATVEELPEGAVRPFAAGALRGLLINDRGTVRAMSRVCTHLGCVLEFQKPEQVLICPCHGAQFDMQGAPVSSDYYPISLPALPPIKVRTRDRQIEVWTI
jgi:nitrite reductase/ring-hydroxylating ferredoxin subunit